MSTPKRPRKMKLADIETCFQRLAERLPDPKTELTYTSPYTLLVAVVLSAQATDVGVNRATKGLFAAAATTASATCGAGACQSGGRVA